MKCINCDYESSDNFSTCPKCGHSIINIQQIQTPQQQVQIGYNQQQTQIQIQTQTIQPNQSINTNNNISQNNFVPKRNLTGSIISAFIIIFILLGIVNFSNNVLEGKNNSNKKIEGTIPFEEYTLSIPKNFKGFYTSEGNLNIEGENYTIELTKIDMENDQIIKKKNSIINNFKNDGGTIEDFKRQTINGIDFITYRGTLKNITYGYMYGKINNKTQVYIYVFPKYDGTYLKNNSSFINVVGNIIATAE